MLTSAAITEHVLFRTWVSADRCPDVRLFRNGDPRYGVLKPVSWNELRAGDIVVAFGANENCIYVLQFWHVLEVQDGCAAEVFINNIVGMAANGQEIGDRLAGLVGL